MTSVILNGHTYTDDANPTTGMAGGGHRQRFIPALADFVVDAGVVAANKIAAAASEAAAAASAASAVASPGTSATSSTSLTVGTGSKSLTIQTGKNIVVGMSVKIASTATPTTWMHGDVTSYTSGTGDLTVAVGQTSGDGTLAAWTISLSSPPLSVLTYPTIRPAMLLDFANSKQLDPRITFTRNSIATYFDADGLLKTAAAGEPRFDHDPLTGECKGLLVEEARANLLLNSSTLSTQSVAVTAQAYAISFYGTGSVVLSGTHATTITGTGAFPTRTSYTFTPTAGTLTLTVSGSVTQAQLEVGAFPTSYIPTTSAAVTRADDVAKMTGDDFSSWYRQDEGTFVSDSSYNSITSYSTVFSADTGYVNNSICVMGNYNATDLAHVNTGGVMMFGTYLPNSIGRHKYALAYQTNNFASAKNGIVNASDTSGTLPVPTQLAIGATGGTSFFLNGHVARITYYPKRLSNAELQGLTA